MITRQKYQATFAALSARISDKVLLHRVRDGVPPIMQFALCLLSDAEMLGASPLAMAAIMPRSILAGLVRRGLIDSEAIITTAGWRLLRSWVSDAVECMEERSGDDQV